MNIDKVTKSQSHVLLPLGLPGAIVTPMPADIFGPGEAERRPLRRHPLAGVAAVQRLLVVSLLADPLAQLRVLRPAIRHVAVAVRRFVHRQLGELRLSGWVGCNS